MRIKIYDADEKHRINLILPLSFMNFKFIWRYGKLAQYGPIARNCYKALKRYIRKNGHFTLVDIDCHDGDKVEIKI